MNILYIEHYAGSDEYGMEFRPYYMAREWAKLGHDVTIVGATFSHLRKKNPVVDTDFTEEMSEGVRFVWVKTNSYKGNRLGRVKNILTFMKKVKKNAQYLVEKYNPDVVINSSTYPMDVYPSYEIAKKSNAKLFYEIHDLWPMSLIEMSSVITEGNPLIKYVQRAEDFCYKNCDGVISILPAADDHIKERGFEDVYFRHVPNGVVIDDTPDAPLDYAHASTLKSLKDEGKFIVLYAGGHALSNALDCFIHSAKYLDEKAVLVLVGKGNEKEKLIKEAQTAGYKNILFMDPVEKNQIPALLSYSDCLYIGAKKSPLYRYGVGMNKMFDYMLAAKPVINGVESPKTPMEMSGCAVAVEAENAKAIAEAVSELMQKSPEELSEMGEKGREYVLNNHQYTTLAQNFIDAMEGCENKAKQ